MKDKIKAALQQGHTNLGITDEEVFERVASAAETFIKEEAQIPEFVSKAGEMLKLYQSQADKARTANKRISELEAELSNKTKPDPSKPDPNKPDPNKPDPNKPSDSDIQKKIEDAINAANQQNADKMQKLLDKLEAFESVQSSKAAIEKAEAEFRKNDYVKGYPKDADKAWKIATKVNEKTGNKMTSEDLLKEALENFSDLVADRGVDIQKPYEGSGDGDKFDPEKYRKALERSGRVKPKK